MFKTVDMQPSWRGRIRHHSWSRLEDLMIYRTLLCVKPIPSHRLSVKQLKRN